MISLIDFLFTVINFSVVVLIIAYLVRYSLIPQLSEKMVEEHRDLVELHEEHRRLALEQEELEHAIVMQEDRAKILFKKINQWRNLVDVAFQSQLATHDLMRKVADERYRESMRNFSLNETYTTVAPVVVKALQEEIKVKFAEPENGHAYIKMIISKLPVNR